MSDRMTPIPFGKLMNWILTEKKEHGTVFGIRRMYRADPQKTLELFGSRLETPFGPAAGPHTQLAQNIIAAYLTGSRFFELKTVQILDGEDLPVAKPCIDARDECYNVEWSTELYVPQAYEEYVKAWYAIKLLSKEFGLGHPDHFIFNMSVGYNLEGIQSPKIDQYINEMMDASKTPIWKECCDWASANLGRFEKIDAAYLETISPKVCNSITESTLHGCPPSEIEKIASYLITEKGLNTFIKCNPTLLGFEFARDTMNAMGYGYMDFNDHYFKNDMQYQDAIPMLHRLSKLAAEKGVSFGVKISNTMPVNNPKDALPGDEMYMSGRSLFPLSIELANRLAKETNGKLRISYSGGADTFNIAAIFKTGVWPITIATTLLKPGGYERMVQQAEILTACAYQPFSEIDTQALDKLASSARSDRHHLKAIKPAPSRKLDRKVPLIDCFTAPCRDTCPIHQDIPEYVGLVGEGKYLEALRVIVSKNPLPFMTGTICAHGCMGKCTRNFYEDPVQIRGVKLTAAEHAFDDLMKEMKATAHSGAKVAVVGGGPAGMAAAYFLSREGLKVTLFEKRESLGGVVRHIIPDFRISAEAIEKDAALIRSMGAEILLNTEAPSVEELKKQGYLYVVLAVGAWKHGELRLKKGEAMGVFDFLAAFKENPSHVNLGRHVVIAGAGNTAMDAARAAKRVPGVESVSIVYRRNRKYMPADEEELELAMEDGVEFRELLAPVSLENGSLRCEKMELGAPDASGRRAPVGTGTYVEVPADTVIASVGEKVDGSFFEGNGIPVGERGKIQVNPETLETDVPGVYVVGDAQRGPSVVVWAIADARRAADAILEKEKKFTRIAETGFVHSFEKAVSRRGILKMPESMEQEGERCLDCAAICENCVDVCPNRANLAIRVPGMAMEQILHVDFMCNECGNCKVFCPYASAPYQDKFTLFANEKDFEDSKNEGFVVLDAGQKKVRVRLDGQELVTVLDAQCQLPKPLELLILTVLQDYSYLLA